jgi:hypothetical protein
MKTLSENWIELSSVDFDRLSEASNTIHHAAQFLAITSKNFIPAKDDDSHTAMSWNPDKNWLIGQQIETAEKYIRLVLDLNEFSLLLVDDDHVSYHRKDLIGLTKQEIILWLKLTLHDVGLDTSSFIDKMHYDIPKHAVDDGGTFLLDDNLLTELIRYRTNGHLVVEHFAGQFSSAQPVWVWPHHFDEGCYVPLQFQANEPITSISFGLAVPDTYYNNPYFYVTTWKKKGDDFTNLPELSPPGKWHKQDWTGQVLEMKNLIGYSKTEQAETVYRFMSEAIENARRLVGWIYK